MEFRGFDITAWLADEIQSSVARIRYLIESLPSHSRYYATLTAQQDFDPDYEKPEEPERSEAEQREHDIAVRVQEYMFWNRGEVSIDAEVANRVGLLLRAMTGDKVQLDPLQPEFAKERAEQNRRDSTHSKLDGLDASQQLSFLFGSPT